MPGVQNTTKVYWVLGAFQTYNRVGSWLSWMSEKNLETPRMPSPKGACHVKPGEGLEWEGQSSIHFLSVGLCWLLRASWRGVELYWGVGGFYVNTALF